ncbi:uncharacterized protein [Onthophagus taurus]|uniref:uncharacterized protein n=1 Tax=Onthophagus taurus TaxID=166361 RepID=UPI000C20C48F|nr:uncharacterized protein LOC111414664 [Onthophagus taurus]
MYQNWKLECCVNTVQKELPFFPKYRHEYLFENELKITWFESNFSQSRYNFEHINIASNACTIIVILLAAKCFENKIHMFGPEKDINYFLVKAFGECILEGNEIHQNLKQRGALSNVNLTVPEGIKHSGLNKQLGLVEWKCKLHMQPLGLTLYKNLKKCWLQWLSCNLSQKREDLYVVLISDSRSVLFILNSTLNTVTLIDSHQHTFDRGAVIAIATRHKMKHLCNWFGDLIYSCYKSTPLLYELSFLYFKGQRGGKSKKKRLKEI